jgi:hypothetical protein
VVIKLIRETIDLLLLNAYSVEQSGILDGKVGISLTLFELSRYFNDEKFENHAFDLLQEALAHDVKGYNFATGQSGLAYAVSYLINNKFIDADYFELFGERHNAIIKTIKTLKYKFSNGLDYTYHLFFIHSLRQYIDNKDYIKCNAVLVSLINKTLNGFEKTVDMKTGNFFHIYASILLSTKYLQNEGFVKKIHRIQKKLEQMNYVCQYPLFPLQMYFAGIKEYDALIRLCMDNIVLQAIDFKQKTNLIIHLHRLYHLDNSLDYRATAKEIMNSLIDDDLQLFENKIYKNIIRSNIFGYGIGSGLSRLILLHLFHDKILQGENVELLNF